MIREAQTGKMSSRPRPDGSRLLMSALILLALPGIAHAWQQGALQAPQDGTGAMASAQEERIPAGQIPLEADILSSSDLNGYPIYPLGL